MTKNLFVFDLDDTLMWNAHTYSKAFCEFYNFLTDLWGKRILYIGRTAQIQEEIDHKLGSEVNPRTGKLYGFGVERFPTSLMLTYERLCEEMGNEYRRDIAEKIYAIGMSVFDECNYGEFVPHARRVLNFLQDEKCTLVLLTKGDPEAQGKKISALGLQGWFEEIHVVDKKTPEFFGSIRYRFGNSISNSFSVGNSFYSDIQPAMEAGFRGIYIPCPTWMAEPVPDKYDESAVLTLSSITDIMNLYKSRRLHEGGAR